MRYELPETCFSTLPGEGKLIILKRGEKGYYPSDWETGSEKENKLIADTHNRRCGLNPAQVMAMQVGSMFGFDVPGANPQSYLDEARLVGTYPLHSRAMLKGLDDSIFGNLKGSMYQYQVAGETCFYLAPVTLQAEIIGMNCYGMVLPDMIHGQPLVPVDVEWLEHSNFRMSLQRGSFSTEKEVNHGYEIIAKVPVGSVEYVLGAAHKEADTYATGESTPANGGDGFPTYYWGHSLKGRNEAIQEFCKRAAKRFQMLSVHREPSIREQLAARPAPRPRPDKKQKSHQER